jgi:ribosomal protein L29
MKKKDLQQFKDKSIDELSKLVGKKRVEFDKAKVELKSGNNKNNKKPKNLKKEIAQILTIIKEKEIMDHLSAKNEGGVKKE